MPTIDTEVHTPISTTVRARQLSSMFDVPPTDVHTIHWHIEAPWEDQPWNVGLIVGPSGSGKTTILRALFGEPKTYSWDAPSVIDAFGDHPVDDIAKTCGAVGFNTIPAWLRPYDVLSSGEKFRVEMARLMLDVPHDDIISVDEFTSVVDRQVAQIGSHAVAKFVRRSERQLVAASCHYDIIDWLQPDWVLDVAAQSFSWRSLQRRPSISVEIAAVPYEVWARFAPFHYLTAELHKMARSYAAFVNDEPVAFAAIMRRPHPHPRAANIMSISRLVTLPDWQGLGLAFVLAEALGASYRHVGERVRTYPAHPALVHAFAKNPRWRMAQKPGIVARRAYRGPNARRTYWRMGKRPCAVFEYIGDAHPDRDAARALLHDAHGRNIDDVWERFVG